MGLQSVFNYMAQDYPKNSYYSKRPLWQWILIYVIMGGIIYFLIYLFFSKSGTYNYNPPQYQNSQDKILNLSNQGLTSLPANIFNQTNLEELNISNNNLTGAIQAEIRNLVNLRILNAANNQMTGVPAEIGQLQNLEVLDLSNNKLTGLPNELGNLKNLKTLNIKENPYSQQDLDYIRNKLPSTVDIIVN